MKVGDRATVLVNRFGYQWIEKGICGPHRRRVIEAIGLRPVAVIRIKSIKEKQA